MKILPFLLFFLTASTWGASQQATKTLTTNVNQRASVILATNVSQITSKTLPITVVSHLAILTWQAGICPAGQTCETAVSFRVYRGTTSGGPYSIIGNPVNMTFTDNIVFAGNTYYYVVTAVGSDGQESAFSNQAMAVIP